CFLFFLCSFFFTIIVYRKISNIRIILMRYFMSKLHAFFSSSIQLHLYWIILVAIIYIIIHTYRNKSINQLLDIYFNYIPVLTHEFGHILFNKLSGGKARDLVIVARPSERLATSQQGFAITQSKN